MSDDDLRRIGIKYTYYADTGTLALYFTEALPGVIRHSADMPPGVLVDYDKDERIVSVDLMSAAESTACHFFDVPGAVDGKAPLAVMWDYNAEQDSVTVHLAGCTPPGVTEVETEEPRICLLAADDGRWHALRVREASKAVCFG